MRWAVVALTFNPSTEAGLCKFKAGVVLTFQGSQVYTETSRKPDNNEVLLCLRVIDLFLTESFFPYFYCVSVGVCASQISLQESLVFIYKVAPGEGTQGVFRGGSKHLTC